MLNVRCHTMTLSLHNLKKFKGSTKRKKIIGRGNASGHGTYSTRGQKGQKARSGTGGLKYLGMKKTLLSTPKFKGQKIRRPKMAVVNIDSIDRVFDADTTINAETLLSKGLISDDRAGIKILGNGNITKKFTVIAEAFSQSAKEAIIKAGGKVIIKN